MQPDVHVNTLSSTAGQNVSVKCNFTIPDNLFRAPSVQWVDSSGLVVSATHNLTFSPLLTSNGGKYTCNVTINITELNITLTGIGNINITVQSKFSHFTLTIVFLSLSVVQFPVRRLILKKLECHILAQSIFSHVLWE